MNTSKEEGKKKQKDDIDYRPMLSVRNSWATIIYCTGQFSMIWLYYKVLPAHQWPLSLSGESASMAMTYPLSQTLDRTPPNVLKIRSSSEIDGTKPHITQVQTKKRCLRCSTLYFDKDNSPIACSFHGHTTGMQLCIFLLTNLLKEFPVFRFYMGVLCLQRFVQGRRGYFLCLFLTKGLSESRATALE